MEDRVSPKPLWIVLQGRRRLGLLDAEIDSQIRKCE